MADRSNDADEAVLIAAAKGGDARAFETLLHRHESRVFRVLRLLGVPRSDREDVAQEVFLRLFRGLSGFRAGRPFASWVYKIAANASHDWRARAARGRAETPWTEAAESWARPGPASDERLELAQRLEAALGALSEREREVFVLVEMEGVEREEAARLLGISAVTVRRHLGLAKDRLRSALEASSKKATAR